MQTSTHQVADLDIAAVRWFDAAVAYDYLFSAEYTQRFKFLSTFPADVRTLRLGREDDLAQAAESLAAWMRHEDVEVVEVGGKTFTITGD